MRSVRLVAIEKPLPLAGVRCVLRPEIVFAAASIVFLLDLSGASAGDGPSPMLRVAPSSTPTRSAREDAAPFIWVPSLTQPPNRVSDDLDLGLRARNLLLQEKVLAGQILGVTVRNRIAILWGVVSSPSVALHAENCLRGLPGLVAIRCQLSIDPGTEHSGERNPGCDPPPPLPESRRVPGKLVHRVEEQASTPGLEFHWRPAGQRGPERTPARPAKSPLPSERRAVKLAAESLPGFPSSDSNGASLPVMPALVLPPLPSVANAARPGMPPPPAGFQTTASLLSRIEAVRLADDRFRGLRAEVRGDAVYLRGTVYSWDHLFELARSLSQLPGVRRVLFEEVRVESP
jgi:hypothetical protein